MADRPDLVLEFFPNGCPDCGRRRAVLPGEPVAIPDDFDWTARDYEGFRRFMLEELASSDPERQRWTEADVELMLVEVLAAGLDRASHALDAVFAERFLQTARLPQSVTALIDMIDGLDSAYFAVSDKLVPQEKALYGFSGSEAGPGAAMRRRERLMAAFSGRPSLMDDARAAALLHVGEIRSFVSLADLERFLESCPAIVQARVRFISQGGTPVYEAHVLLAQTGVELYDKVSKLDDVGEKAFKEFFLREIGRSIPPDQPGDASIAQQIADSIIAEASIRTALIRLIAPLLPFGSRLHIVEGKRAGVFLRLCVQVASNYFRSEVEMAVRQLLGNGPGQLFDPRRLGFGEALMLSDLQAAIMALDGVDGVLINRLQIVGRPASEASATGILRPRSDEALTFDPTSPGIETGYMVLKMAGGQLG